MHPKVPSAAAAPPALRMQQNPGFRKILPSYRTELQEYFFPAGQAGTVRQTLSAPVPVLPAAEPFFVPLLPAQVPSGCLSRPASALLSLLTDAVSGIHNHFAAVPVLHWHLRWSGNFGFSVLLL